MLISPARISYRATGRICRKVIEKPRTSSVQKQASRQNQPEVNQSDERFQRVFLLLVLVTLLTFIIVPKGALTPTEFTAGDIAPRDIKAPRDLLVPDEDLTKQKRDEAEKGVANLYDFDTTTGEVIIGQVEPGFYHIEGCR